MAQLGEELGLAPHRSEATAGVDVAGQELAVDHERAGVHVAHRVDEADDPAGAAQVQSVERLAECGEMEEGVAGEDPGVGRAASGRGRAAARLVG